METIKGDQAGWYNGFSWKQRERKLREYKKRLAAGNAPSANGVCRLCCDPTAPLEYHDEDYGEPYVWTEPASYVLCRDCHVHRLHKRFSNPARWSAFLAHVRRGGYARDLKESADIKREFEQRVSASKPDDLVTPRRLRPYPHTIGQEWFARLSTDPRCLTSPTLWRNGD